MKISIVYEDDDLLVIDKPAGLHSSMLTGEEDPSETVAGLLAEMREECRDSSEKREDAGLVNRLDRWTSGLLIAAKSRDSWSFLRAELASGRIEKSYLAVVEGEAPKNHSIATFLGTPNRRAAKMKVFTSRPKRSMRALPAETAFERVAYHPTLDLSLVRATAHTARRHQIRAHAAHMGHPLLGDTLYGATRDLSIIECGSGRGFLLHCDRLKLISPSGKVVEASSPLPEEMTLFGC